ncbi:hypothetical protein [Streptomyces iakyrus]|uniref:hypothetical protein n=1 Tax=Streptomyces iakyrus TaxID=68219 RepID=UPI003D8C878B
MKNTEDGLNAHDGHVYGPLADAALRRAAADGSTDFSTMPSPQKDGSHITAPTARRRCS